MRKKIFYSTIVLLLLLVALAHYLLQWNPFKPVHSASIKAGNRERTFSYYVPAGVTANPKLVFVLHGSTMTAGKMILVTGHQFNKLADEYKDAIIVYPQGYQDYWNDCRKGAANEAQQSGINDIAFFEQMIHFFAAKYNINTKDVFVAGYSGGGQMCFKLAKERPGLFKGFAAISANLPVETNDNCVDAHLPVSILVMNGTADPINPYNGGEMNTGDGSSRGIMMSTQQTIRYWTSLAVCDTASMTTHNLPDIDAEDHSTAVQYDYKCASSNKEVVLVKINNGGHNVPNPTFFLWPGKVGNVNKDINAPAIIYHYFMHLQ